MSRRSYHDPLHGEIVLDRSEPAEAMAIDLIDALLEEVSAKGAAMH